MHHFNPFFRSLCIIFISKTQKADNRMLLRIFILSSIILQSIFSFAQTKEVTTEITSATINYVSNEHQITETNVVKIMEFIGKNPSKKGQIIHIESHTDQVGNSTANQQLSERRTASVRTELIRLGIDSSTITSFAYGENKPLKTGKGEDSYSQNRRSVIRIMQPTKYYLLKGTVRPDTTTQNFKAKVLISNSTFRDSFMVGKDREFAIYVPVTQKLNLSASAKNFFSQSIAVNVPANEEIPPVNIILKSIIIDRSFDIKDIKFVGDQAAILSESMPSLENLLQTMQINDNVCFEIGGHVNFPGEALKSGSNFQLAIDRAKIIYTYLSNNGIDAKRMQSVGYSNTKMKFPNPKSEAEQQENRRVEIIIRKCGK